jgi:hypothetical protein
LNARRKHVDDYVDMSCYFQDVIENADGENSDDIYVGNFDVPDFDTTDPRLWAMHKAAGSLLVEKFKTMVINSGIVDLLRAKGDETSVVASVGTFAMSLHRRLDRFDGDDDGQSNAVADAMWISSGVASLCGNECADLASVANLKRVMACTPESAAWSVRSAILDSAIFKPRQAGHMRYLEGNTGHTKELSLIKTRLPKIIDSAARADVRDNMMALFSLRGNWILHSSMFRPDVHRALHDPHRIAG